jgi:hypothetical protein
MSAAVSTLESLPDELFLDIFDYLSARDLYDGFYHLNRRFASILASVSNLYGDITIKAEEHSHGFRYFASRITVLRIEHVEAFDLSLFSAIRSLTLHTEPNRNQCQSIQLLSRLKHLSTFKPSISHFYYSTSLSHFVFTNAYPSLRSCRLNLIPYKDKQQWTRVPSLRTLSVNVGDSRVYPQILYACPSLVRFEVQFIQYFTRPPKSFCASAHTSLRRFDLRLNCMAFSCCQIIDLLLSLIPKLRHFSVIGSLNDANDISIDGLATILVQRVPQLDRLRLVMAVQESLAHSLTVNNCQRIRQLHPLFYHLTIVPSTEHIPARLTIESKEQFA